MIVLVWGTRPESIKLGPIAAALRDAQVPFVSISTGQHTSLLAGTPAETDLADSVSLGIPSTGAYIGAWVELALPKTQEALIEADASLVVVQGDTMSALAGARAGHALGIPVAHVEAGLRSGDLEDPWPEEGFRREITQLARWHFAPTHTAMENLLAEGIAEETIFLTGNPVVSALHRYAEASPQPAHAHILLTMHRREWLLSTDLRHFLCVLNEVCADYPGFRVFWPIHPAVKARWPLDWNAARNLHLGDPLPYEDTVTLLATAHGLVTDSGGLVEEAATLGVPTAVMRHHTDRPEAIEAGVARMFAPTDLESAFHWLTQDHPRKPTTVYGSPDAASQIATHLRNLICPDTPQSMMASGSSPAVEAT